MAFFLNELAGSKMKCRDSSGKIVPCPRPSSVGCTNGCSLGMDKIVPFDLPVIGGVEQFDITDAIIGALAGKAVTGVATAVVQNTAGQKWANYAKLGIGSFAIGGLAFETLRSSPMFLGFSFATWPEMAEPVTDFAADKILWALEKVTGKVFRRVSLPAEAQNLSGIAPSRRIGQERGAPAYRPTVKTPSQLIAEGTRMGGTTRSGTAGLMSGSAFKRPVVNSLRTS